MKLPPPPPEFGNTNDRYSAPNPETASPNTDFGKDKAQQPNDHGSETRIISQHRDKRGGRDSGDTTRIILIVAITLIVVFLSVAAYFFFVADKPTEDLDAKFNYDDDIEEVAVPHDTEQATAPEYAPDEQRMPTPHATHNVWKDGRNILSGTFIFQGARYGFTVTLNYSSGTGRATDVTYEAAGYGEVSKLSSATISSDGTVLYIRGTASGSTCEISATAHAGSRTFSGDMTRGDHVGTCTMTLK